MYVNVKKKKMEKTKAEKYRCQRAPRQTKTDSNFIFSTFIHIFIYINIIKNSRTILYANI